MPPSQPHTRKLSTHLQSGACPARTREERFFAVEDVLGRDAASVFPTESRKAMLDSEPVKALLSENRKFISESELHEIQVAAGGRRRVEDGSVAADKPLVEVLREAREAKESKFQEQWKQMKTVGARLQRAWSCEPDSGTHRNPNAARALQESNCN